MGKIEDEAQRNWQRGQKAMVEGQQMVNNIVRTNARLKELGTEYGWTKGPDGVWRRHPSRPGLLDKIFRARYH